MTQTTAVKKPFVKALAVLSALMLSLAACGEDTGGSNSTPAPDSQTTATQNATTAPATEQGPQNGGSGAQNGESEVVMNNVVNGVDMTFTYYAVGDEVTRQTTKNVMPYEVLGVTTADEARPILDPMVAEFQGIPGLEHSLEYGDTEAVETLTVDYAVADLQTISELTGSTFSGDTSEGAKVSLQQSLEMLEGQGFTRVN